MSRVEEMRGEMSPRGDPESVRWIRLGGYVLIGGLGISVVGGVTAGAVFWIVGLLVVLVGTLLAARGWQGPEKDGETSPLRAWIWFYVKMLSGGFILATIAMSLGTLARGCIGTT